MMKRYLCFTGYGVFDQSVEPNILIGIEIKKSEAIKSAKEYNSGDDIEVCEIEILRNQKPVKL